LKSLRLDKVVWQPYLSRIWPLLNGSNLGFIERGYTSVMGSVMSYSIGARVLQNGMLQSVSWDGPAFKAGIVPGMKIAAVDGKAFRLDTLRQRIQAALPRPIMLSVSNEAGEIEELDIAYRAGLRFPDLSSLN
jgi:predicted metalloprotease with PDZ domain